MMSTELRKSVKKTNLRQIGRFRKELEPGKLFEVMLAAVVGVNRRHELADANNADATNDALFGCVDVGRWLDATLDGDGGRRRDAS